MDLSGRADPKTDMEACARPGSKARSAPPPPPSPRGKKPTRPASTCRPPSAQVPGRGLRRYRHQDKPRNLIGIAKSIPDAQMEEMLRSVAPVGDEQLRQLADARAQAV